MLPRLALVLGLVPELALEECVFELLPAVRASLPPSEDAKYLGLSTARPLSKVQSIYLAPELVAAGLAAGDAIQGLRLHVAAANRQTLERVRVALKELPTVPALQRWGVGRSTFAASVAEADVRFGPAQVAAPLQAGEHHEFSFGARELTWGGGNLLLELSKDNGQTSDTLDAGAPFVKYANPRSRSAVAYTFYKQGGAFCTFGGWPFAAVAEAGCPYAGKSIKADLKDYVLDIQFVLRRSGGCTVETASPTPAPTEDVRTLAPTPAPKPPEPAPPEPAPPEHAGWWSDAMAFFIAILILIFCVLVMRRGRSAVAVRGTHARTTELTALT